MSALRLNQTASPVQLIERTAREQARLANREKDLRLDLMDTPAPMSEDYLAKVVNELVHNGFKFSQAGTPVRVGLSNGSNQLAFTVTDQGRGFSTDHIRKVGAYMQFDRKMQEQQGLGLGLSIAKRLTELHGGTLSIQSKPGSLTEVTMKLPKRLP
jgi:signal transduction histidine kinase